MSDYDPIPARYFPPTYAQDVIELLDQLAIPQAIFVGTSLGGLVTMLMAVMAPHRIAAAILNDIGPEIDDAGVDRIKSYVGKGVRFTSWDEAAETIARNNATHSTITRTTTGCGWRSAIAARTMARSSSIMTRRSRCRSTRRARRPQFDMWPLFAALAQKPLLVIRGAKSDLLSAEALEKMHAAAPDMKSAVVPGVGHAPELNEPEAVAAIDAFLGEVERAESYSNVPMPTSSAANRLTTIKREHRQQGRAPDRAPSAEAVGTLELPIHVERRDQP